jgi:hypothetical protein
MNSDQENTISYIFQCSIQSVKGYYAGNLGQLAKEKNGQVVIRKVSTVIGWIETAFPMFNDFFTNSPDNSKLMSIVIEDQQTKSDTFEETSSYGFGFLTSGRVATPVVGFGWDQTWNKQYTNTFGQTTSITQGNQKSYFFNLEQKLLPNYGILICTQMNIYQNWVSCINPTTRVVNTAKLIIGFIFIA